MDYMIGCNYWASNAGADMWAEWDETSVEADLAKLSEYNVKYLRVFTNWRDFQPVHAMRTYLGRVHEYRLHGKYLLKDEFGLDMDCMAHFERFCAIAKKYDIKLIVSLVTGWMSGRVFVPPVVEGKNHITDPDSLMWQSKFVRGFVRQFKDNEQIVAWDLGNECNCLSKCTSRGEAYVWTSMIRNSILSEDSTRIIMSGMHSLSGKQNDIWTIQDQGELTDMLTPHPYPSPTVGGDIEPMVCLRTTLIPTIQVDYYSSLAKKPAMIQEIGTFNDMVGNRERAAMNMRVNLFSGWANGSKGYLWWCAHEQSMLELPPYSWSAVERELGLLDAERNPKPVANMMKKVYEVLNTLPFNTLPPKDVDAVCITTREQDFWHVAASSYILAKQAGFELRFMHFAQTLPDAKIYIVPSLKGWSPMNNDIYQKLLEKAENGATVYFSTENGFITNFEKTTGLCSEGMQNRSKDCVTVFCGHKFKFRYGKEFLLKSIGAKILATAEDGNVVFSVNKFGKGKIYYLNFPIEDMLWNSESVFSATDEQPYYKFYKEIANDVLEQKIIRSDNPNICVTQHKLTEDSYIAVAINYSKDVQKTEFIVNKNMSVKALYGNVEYIDGCDALILEIR